MGGLGSVHRKCIDEGSQSPFETDTSFALSANADQDEDLNTITAPHRTTTPDIANTSPHSELGLGRRGNKLK